MVHQSVITEKHSSINGGWTVCDWSDFLIGYLKLSWKTVFSLFRSVQNLVEEGSSITIMYLSKVYVHEDNCQEIEITYTWNKQNFKREISIRQKQPTWRENKNNNSCYGTQMYALEFVRFYFLLYYSVMLNKHFAFIVLSQVNLLSRCHD